MTTGRLKTFFLGTPDFALHALQKTAEHTELLGVVTQPDRPRGRGQNIIPCPVRDWAAKNQYKTWAPASLKKQSTELQKFEADVLALPRPDVLVVVAYGNLLPQKILDWPRLGAVNIHASLLPRWRGAAPIQRALESGDARTGVSLQKIVLELDAGDVLYESSMDLPQNMQAAELSERLSLMGAELLPQFFKDTLQNGAIPNGKKQNSAEVTLAAKISKEEGFWRPSWSAQELHNKVRAFSVWPGVKAALKENPTSNDYLKIVQTQMPLQQVGTGGASAGTLLLKEGNVFLATGSPVSLLKITKLQAPGKGVVDAAAFLAGLRVDKLNLYSI